MSSMVPRSALLAVVSVLSVSCRATSVIPPENVDRLHMKVDVDVEIAGIGKDSFALEGSVAVHRSGPSGPDGKSMTGEMVGAALKGKSTVFGEVFATQDPTAPSPCTYTYEAPGRYRSAFDVQGWFWLPQHNLLVRTGAPVRVEGVAAAIPPVGQKAESVKKDVPLHDLHKPDAPPIGTLSRAAGEVRELIRIKG